MAQQTGTIIQKRYRVLHVLGCGGSGITYEAKDTTTRNRVALKELTLRGLSDWKKLELFEREVKALANLNHPAVPSYIDYFQTVTAGDRYFYLVQELAEGKSLSDLVTAGEQFTETEVRRIALEVLQVLQYLHGLNPLIVHRDIRPQNIICQKDGQIFLVNFGAVQTVVRQTAASGNAVVGTHDYRAPEQFQGQAHPTTDLYGLGATLLNLLTHQSPSNFPKQHLKSDLQPYTTVSDAFATWLEGLLAPVVEDRYDSASTAIAALTNPPPARTRRYTNHAPSTSPQLPVQPWDSRIKLTRSQRQLSLQIPPVGFRGEAGGAFSTVIWIGFVGFIFALTMRVLGGGISLFAIAFSTVFWLVSGDIAWRLARALFARISFEVQGDRFILTTYFLGWRRVQQGNVADLERVDVREFRTVSYIEEAICLQVGTRVHKFGAMLPPSEKDWIVSAIETFIHEQYR
ncbi:MAG: serine/threonine-protein kinase [Cyanobacteria bacterium J06636_16]